MKALHKSNYRRTVMEQNDTSLKGGVLRIAEGAALTGSISELGTALTVPIVIKAEFRVSEIIYRLVEFYLERKKSKVASLLKEQWVKSLNKSGPGYTDFLSGSAVLELVGLFYTHLLSEGSTRTSVYDGRASKYPEQVAVNKMHEGAKKILDPIFSAALKEFKRVRAGEAKAATRKEREAIKEANAALAKIGLKAVRSHTGVSVVQLEEHK
jgi:hypothetical protein